MMLTPKATKMFVERMFPSNHLIVDTIMEHDAKLRYADMTPMVLAYNALLERDLKEVIGEFYDEFVEDNSFIRMYGLHIPTVMDNMIEESIKIAVRIFTTLTTSLSKEEYTEVVFEQIATGIWSRRIAYKVIMFELVGLKALRKVLEQVQEDMGVSFGPLI